MADAMILGTNQAGRNVMGRNTGYFFAGILFLIGLVAISTAVFWGLFFIACGVGTIWIINKAYKKLTWDKESTPKKK